MFAPVLQFFLQKKPCKKSSDLHPNLFNRNFFLRLVGDPVKKKKELFFPTMVLPAKHSLKTRVTRFSKFVSLQLSHAASESAEINVGAFRQRQNYNSGRKIKKTKQN
jgi:hypothetical protein